MPEGPPPGDGENDSDDDIPMPEGPPPGQEQGLSTPKCFGIACSHETELISSLPTLPAGYPPPFMAGASPTFAVYPPPPTGFPQYVPPHLGGAPSPPAGFGFAPPPGALPAMPPAPLGFFPRRNQSSGIMQDPLSGIPHETYQAHQVTPSQSVHPSLPPRPPAPQPAASSAVTAAATVFAAPELRDLKKESTAFLPNSVKRKKAATAASTKLNAAPSTGASAEEPAVEYARPSLLGTLKDQFRAAPALGVKKPQPNDYDKFVAEMGDIL